MDEDWMNLMNTLNCGAMMAAMETDAVFQKKERKKSRYWVSPYLKERNDNGRFMTDFEALRNSPELFNENFRMPPQVFDELYEMVEPHLRPKRNSRPKDFIPIKAKLAVVLEYLASGDLQRHLASCYRISKQHFGRIVKDVCEVLCTVLKNEVPDWTEQNLVEIANGFENQWNFPNCVGAIDGKHISVKAPPKNGFNSIVLLATCDANYKFTYLDIGAYGSEGDSNIMRSSKFGTSIMNDTCLFPPDTVISKQKIPHFIVGDNAFPLCKRLIKPYSTTQLSIEQRIFNYRLSRARRCIKNAFGILTARWLCLRNLLFCKPERAQVVVSACCLLHNFLTNKCRRTYNSNAFSGFEDSTGNWIAGEWEVLQEQEHTRNRNESNVTTYRGRNSDYGKYIRKILTDYINSTNGPIPLQNNATFV